MATTPYQLRAIGDSAVRNLIINGNMDFWQRGISSSSFGYLADRFKTTGSGSYVTTFAQSTDVPTQVQSGWQSNYSFLSTVVTGASIAAGDFQQIIHILEGQDYQQIHGKKVRFQFWCKCSVAGTYAVAFRNSGQTRSYVTTFTVNNANTWEKKVIDVLLDTSGTWLFDNTIGLQINIGLSCGTTFQTATLNSWQNGNFVGATGQTQLAATTGATFQLAQVALYAGSFNSNVSIPFQRCGRNIGHELQLCQRYYEKSFETTTAPANGANATSFSTLNGITAYVCFGNTSLSMFLNNSMKWKVEKRTAPTFTRFGNSTGQSWTATTTSGSESWSSSAQNHIVTDTTGWHSDQEVTGGPITVALHWTADAEL